MNPGSIKQWTMFTIYGWLIGFGLVLFLAIITEAIGLGGYQFFIGIGMGLGIGYMQGRVMSLYFNINNRWMIYTTVGMGVSFTLFDFGHHYLSVLPEYNLFYSISLGGFLTALLQFTLLRRIFTRAWLWIPTCFLSWVLAGLAIRFSETIESFGLTGLPAAFIVLIILTIGASSVLGIVSGLGLRMLINTMNT
jgi:hypothetical protein